MANFQRNIFSPPGGVEKTAQAIRSELKRLQARYDGITSPAIFAVIRKLEVELSWFEHASPEDEDLP
jgi:hypothetical protein